MTVMYLTALKLFDRKKSMSFSFFIIDDPDERMMELIDELLKCLRPLEFKPMKDLHLSLSRTVAIRHHWIQPLTDRLQRRFKLLPK